MRRPDPALLDALFEAIHDSVGLCRLEATTFRTVALTIPAIRAAAEDLMGGSLLQEELRPTADGVLLGRLSKDTYRMFSTSQMRSAWPALVQKWQIAPCTDANWVTFYPADGPAPKVPPPRIDHLTCARLPHTWVPVDESWLLPCTAQLLNAEQHRTWPVKVNPPVSELKQRVDDIYVCAIGPIDYWGGWMLAESAEQYDLEELPPATIPHAAFLKRAFEEARKLGWEGDIREGPFVSVLPDGFDSVPVVAWKQDNNGITFVASPYPLPHLEPR